MPIIRFFGIICFSVSLYAQFSGAQGISVTGEIRSHGDIGSNQFLVEVYDSRTNTVIERAPVSDGQFELDRVPPGSYTVRVLTGPGSDPVIEEYHQFESGSAPLILTLPEHTSEKPISGVVSVHDLEHPVSKKAIREAYQAQKLERANEIPQAISKLENAIRIDPLYRDAHVNLGVLYARAGRTVDAKAQFQKALDIGPPAAPVYADLALTFLALQQYRDAETSARKALELDSANTAAQRVLKYTSQR